MPNKWVNPFTVLVGVYALLLAQPLYSQGQAAANSQSTQSEFHVIAVNDYKIMFNAAEVGGMISFKSDRIEQCDLSFILSKFKDGYVTRVSKIGQGEIDLNCLTDEGLFALSEDNSTSAQLSVKQLTDKVVLDISFELSNPQKKSKLKRSHVELVITAMQLQTMRNAK